jgi:hypothetical protein
MPRSSHMPRSHCAKYDKDDKDDRICEENLSDFCPNVCQISERFLSNFAAPGFWNFFRKENGKTTVLPVCGSRPNWEARQYLSTLLYLVAGVFTMKHDITRPDAT